jgi:uncharacterized protein DUF3489
VSACDAKLVGILSAASRTSLRSRPTKQFLIWTGLPIVWEHVRGALLQRASPPGGHSGFVAVKAGNFARLNRRRGKMPTKTRKTTTPRARKTAVKTKATPKQIATADESKKDLVLRLLRRQNGASVTELAEATAWQSHSVRGFLTATVRKKLELPLISTKEPGGARRYHIAALKPAKE